MIPCALHIKDFGPFKGLQHFYFPKEPGFYFMWGDNQEEPRLGGNGAGKSKLWDALVWVIFGKTSRGLTAGEAANWEAGKGAEVTLELYSEEKGPFFMKRTWSPNTWTFTDLFGNKQDLAKDPHNPFLEELRLEFAPFLNSVVMSQFEPMFLDLKPNAKEALFSEVMGLDHWLDYSQRAGKKAAAFDQRCRELERELSRIKGQLDELRSNTDLEELSEAWRAKIKDRRQELARQHALLIKAEKGLEAKLEEQQAEVALVRIELDKAQAKLEKAKKCPTCGQRMESDDAWEVNDLKRRLQKEEQAVGMIRRDLALNDRDLNDLEDQDDRLAGEKNPYAKAMREADDRELDLRAGLKNKQRLLDDADSQYRIFSAWVKWFKEIRLELIGEAITQLEVEVNSGINELGLVGWELLFEVDRETKSGSIKRGFHVFVRSPRNARLVPWEAWSGGEAQRLRVAAQEGLANLIRARTGVTFPLEVWDEPTQGMSEQGVADLLESLKARAKREQRQIWIVDHRSFGFGGFDGSVGVVKTAKGGSTFQDATYICPKDDADEQPLHQNAARRKSLHDLGTRAGPR